MSRVSGRHHGRITPATKLARLGTSIAKVAFGHPFDKLIATVRVPPRSRSDSSALLSSGAFSLCPNAAVAQCAIAIGRAVLSNHAVDSPHPVRTGPTWESRGRKPCAPHVCRVSSLWGTLWGISS